MAIPENAAGVAAETWDYGTAVDALLRCARFAITPQGQAAGLDKFQIQSEVRSLVEYVGTGATNGKPRGLDLAAIFVAGVGVPEDFV